VKLTPIINTGGLSDNQVPRAIGGNWEASNILSVGRNVGINVARTPLQALEVVGNVAVASDNGYYIGSDEILHIRGGNNVICRCKLRTGKYSRSF